MSEVEKQKLIRALMDGGCVNCTYLAADIEAFVRAIVREEIRNGLTVSPDGKEVGHWRPLNWGDTP